MKVGFVVWVLFGIASAVVASIRKGNVRLWFGIGMLLGPIGFGLAFASGYRCSWCKERVSFAANECPYCHHDISGWATEIDDRQSGNTPGGQQSRKTSADARRNPSSGKEPE
jgi:hypothetical protein